MPPVPAAVPAPNAPTAAPANVAKPAAPAVDPKAGAPVDEPLFEVKVGGELKKFKKSEAERLLAKAGFADATVSHAKNALKAAAELKQKFSELESVWDDDARLEAELEKRGKLDALARKRLAKKIAEQEMTPEQKAKAEAEARAQQAEEKLKALEEERAQQKLTEGAKRMQAQIENELDAAWERAGFERGADSFFAVYEVMQEFKNLGLLDPRQPFTPGMADRIIDTARENMEAVDKRREAAVLKGLRGKALYDRLGKSVIDEINRYQLEQLRGGGVKKAPGAPVQKPTEPATFISPQEAMRKMRGGQ